MESNEIEITENLTTRYYLVLGIIVVIFIVIAAMFSQFPPVLFYVLIIEAILAAIIVPLWIYAYTRNKWVTYALSKEKFMIVKPKKVRFEISWSEFDVMKFKLLGSEFATLKPRKLERKSNIFKIKFLRGNEQIKDIKFGVLHRHKARELGTAIINYAKNMGKDIILKQRAIELRGLDTE
ncbi:MAG: hypothetical protein ACFE8L_07825 [Candidatus Hodarchaeota archaeon]